MARFLFCLPRYHTNAAPWIEVLKTAGHDVGVDVVLVGPTENHSVLQPVKHNPGPLSRFLHKIRMGGDSSLHDFPPIGRYWRHMRRVNPDVVVVRGITRRFCRVAALCAFVQRRKLVIYDQEDVTPARWTGTWMRRAVLRIVGIPHFTSLLEGPAHRPATTGSAKSIPFGCAHLEHDVRRWRRRILEWPPRILMVAKYRQRKGHANLLIALAAIKSEVPFTVTFCGEEASNADVQLRSRLERQAAELGIADRVSFIRNVPHAEMGKVFASHDLFVLPSVDEPAAVSPIEAAWAGCAVLLSRDSGTRGYFPPGDSYDFDPESTEDIARALRKVLTSSKELTEARDRCRNRLESIASREVILRSFEEFLK